MYPRKYSKKNSSRPPYVTAIKAIAITKVDSHGLEIVSTAMTAMVAVTNKKLPNQTIHIQLPLSVLPYLNLPNVG